MVKNPFLVHVTKHRRSKGSRWNEVRSGPIAGLECCASSVPEDEMVRANVMLEAVQGGISVSGSVEASWVGVCSRCLAPASGPVHIFFLEHFTEGGDGSDTYPLCGDEIDLVPMIRDAVLLELPQAPLCRKDCRGLCPVCGADRNVQSCGCPDAYADERWAVLGTLKFEDHTGAGPSEQA